MLVEKEIDIKVYEIDVMGIVNNVVYIKWFEDLRHAFLDKYSSYQEMIKEGKSPILIKTEANYLTPLTIYDKPKGRIWASKVGRTKWEMKFEITSGEVINCTGTQTGCYYDIRNKVPTSIPDKIVDSYNREKQLIC